MTYISILPKNDRAQARLTENSDAVMELLFAAAKDLLPIPDSDIIVELNRSTTISFHRAAVDAEVAPDVVLSFATSDDHLQPLFAALSERVVSDWNEQFGDIKIEVWMSLIDTWGTNTDV